MTDEELEVSVHALAARLQAAGEIAEVIGGLCDYLNTWNIADARAAADRLAFFLAQMEDQ